MADLSSSRERNEIVEGTAAAKDSVAAVPVVVADKVVVGEAIPIPVMMPRATYPFGWSRTDLRRFLFLMFAAAVFLLFLLQVQAVLPPFLIAFFLAALLDPSLRYMESHGRSRGYAILIFYLLALMVVVAIVVFIVPLATRQVADISQNLGNYVTSIQQSVDAFMQSHAKILSYLGIKQTKLSDLFRAKSGPAQAAIAAFLDGVRSVVQGMLSKVFWFIIIPVAGFFFMRDYPRLRAHLIWLCPERHQERIDLISREIVEVFSAYLRGLAKICALYAFCAFILFELLNVHYAVFLGLLAGLFYAVPYVGNLITALSAATIAYLMQPHRALLFWLVPAHSAAYAVLVAVCCIVLANVVFDQMVYPRVVGGSVGLHPILSLFALSAGATLFGVWGMLLATPVAASIQIILTYFFPKLAQPPPAHLIDTSPPLT